MYKISVIVPNYNHAPHLCERLDSIYNQIFQDYEVILLDDASTDNSVEILRQYSDRPNTQLFVNEKNSGSTFVQWNKGVDLAHGEYIWIAESDDIADPCFLDCMLKAFKENPNIKLAHCDSKMIDASGSVISESLIDVLSKKYDLDGYTESHVKKGEEQILERMVHCNAISNASAVLFRREDYIKAGMADENLKLSGDKLMWVKLLEMGDYSFINEPLNSWRRHKNTASELVANNSGHDKEMSYVLRYLMANHEVPVASLFKLLEQKCSSEQLKNNQYRWLTNLTVHDAMKSITPDQFMDHVSVPHIIRYLGKRIRRKFFSKNEVGSLFQ